MKDAISGRRHIFGAASGLTGQRWLVIFGVGCLSSLFALMPASGQDVKQPLYRGMWLPQEFLPAPFVGYPGEKPNQLNPPRSNGSRLAAREFEVQ